MKNPLVAALRLAPLFLITACGAPEEVKEDSSIAGVITGRFVPDQELAGYLRDAGFPESVVPVMVCTAKYESSQRTGSYNNNDNGSIDKGLFQINSIHWRACGANSASLENPAVNARCAHYVWRNQGLRAWYGYRSHASECNSYRLRGGNGNASSCDMNMVRVCERHNGGHVPCLKKYCPSRAPR